MTARVTIQTGDFNLSDEVDALRKNDKRVGAICTFTGTVRDRNMAPTLSTACGSLPPEGALSLRPGEAGSVAPAGEDRAPTLDNSGVANDSVLSMELEHYPGMTEKAIEAMIDEAMLRFDIFGARVIHRVGLLQPLDQIVMVAVISAHRGESFKACEFLMDYLKTQAPLWKKEETPAGARWVDARVSDDAALAKWGIGALNA